jgi:membrane protein DedA with SNARE-associated domain
MFESAIAQQFIYLLIPLAIIIEGDATLFTLAFFMKQGVLDPLSTSLIIVCSIFIGDIGWYMIGNKLLQRFSFLNKLVAKVTSVFDRQLTKHTFRFLILTKFTYGIHHAVLVRAGQLGVPFKKYVQMIIFADAIWLVAIGGMGYFFSASYDAIKPYIKFAEFTLLLGVILFFVIERTISHFVQKKLAAKEEKE